MVRYYFLGSYSRDKGVSRHAWAGLIILSETSNQLRHARLIFFEPASKNSFWKPNWNNRDSDVELRVPPVVGEVNPISRWIKEAIPFVHAFKDLYSFFFCR